MKESSNLPNLAADVMNVRQQQEVRLFDLVQNYDIRPETYEREVDFIIDMILSKQIVSSALEKRIKTKEVKGKLGFWEREDQVEAIKSFLIGKHHEKSKIDTTEERYVVENPYNKTKTPSTIDLHILMETTPKHLFDPEALKRLFSHLYNFALITPDVINKRLPKPSVTAINVHIDVIAPHLTGAKITRLGAITDFNKIITDFIAITKSIFTTAPTEKTPLVASAGSALELEKYRDTTQLQPDSVSHRNIFFQLTNYNGSRRDTPDNIAIYHTEDNSVCQVRVY